MYSLSAHRQRNAVHPHVRGEHSRVGPGPLGDLGSPPRAWGTCKSVILDGWTTRFTPTCVGNIPDQYKSDNSHSVHPHVRGEHLIISCVSIFQPGSPPRAWGTWRGDSEGGHTLRFTPTCVGNMPSSRPPSPNASVHPHVRGEHSALRFVSMSLTGSPPRAWGTFVKCPLRCLAVRFTPTCVGNIGSAGC